MKVTTIGIDLAKSVFQVHGVDERGKAGDQQTAETRSAAVALPSDPS